MVNLTKRAIMESFIKLLGKYPFDKITVKDIVEDCGVNRNTFYYHYHDIYELLDDILMQESERALADNMHYESFTEGIKSAASFALQNKKALYHLYNSISRRQIDEYLSRTAGKFMTDYLKERLNGRTVREEDFQFICDFYRCAVVGMILQWLDGGMKDDPDYIISKLDKLIIGTFDQMLENAE